MTRDKNKNKAEIYNTIGLNNCPEDKFKGITEDAVDKASGSQQTKLTGRATGSSTASRAKERPLEAPPTSSMGSRWPSAARSTASCMTRPSGSSFYQPNTVNRDTVWTYNKGTRVYELTALKLRQAGSTRSATQPLQLTANGTAHVVNDDLYDSYQRRVAGSSS